MRDFPEAYGKLDEEEMEQLRIVVGRILNRQLPNQEIEDWHAVTERTKKLTTLFQNLDREQRLATADEKVEVEKGMEHLESYAVQYPDEEQGAWMGKMRKATSKALDGS